MLHNFLLEKCILPAGDKLLGTTFIKDLHYWRAEAGKMNERQLQQLQQQRLSLLLKHAATTIPFYRQQNIQLSANPYTDIKKFPIMHKKLVKENSSLMFVGNKNKMIIEKSSGSSGIQGEVYMTQQENRRYQAVQTFLWEWSGYRIGEPMMQTGVSLKRGIVKQVKDRLFRTHYVNAFELEHKKMVSELKEAKQKKCKFFGGYASSLNVYAEAAIEAGLDIHFDGVIAWGDKLFDHYKSNLTRAFHSSHITELYGTTEGFVISGTCEKGNHHQLSPQTYIELLDKEGNEVEPGEMGYVVATRLDAFSFPLIRFYLGDLAIKEPPGTVCSCGRSFPLLKKIIGRDTDIIHTPSGKALIVHFFTGIFEHTTQIQQFKIIQRTKEAIEIEYIPAVTFTAETCHTIQERIYQKANETFPIYWKKVAVIAPTPSGKPQIIQNFIPDKLR